MSSNSGHLLLVPRSGAIFGGTPVRVYGLCAQEPKDIKCVFDSKVVEGKYYPDQGQFVCVTPTFQNTGRVQFTLTFTFKSGEKQTQSSIFSVGKLLSQPLISIDCGLDISDVPHVYKHKILCTQCYILH